MSIQKRTGLPRRELREVRVSRKCRLHGWCHRGYRYLCSFRLIGFDKVVKFFVQHFVCFPLDIPPISNCLHFITLVLFTFIFWRFVVISGRCVDCTKALDCTKGTGLFYFTLFYFMFERFNDWERMCGVTFGSLSEHIIVPSAGSACIPQPSKNIKEQTPSSISYSIITIIRSLPLTIKRRLKELPPAAWGYQNQATSRSGIKYSTSVLLNTVSDTIPGSSSMNVANLLRHILARNPHSTFLHKIFRFLSALRK